VSEDYVAIDLLEDQPLMINREEIMMIYKMKGSSSNGN
jgi:hypothetical protein